MLYRLGSRAINILYSLENKHIKAILIDSILLLSYRYIAQEIYAYSLAYILLLLTNMDTLYLFIQLQRAISDTT